MERPTIKLFLVSGNPNGLRTAELTNWSGKAIAAPRSELSLLYGREEISNPGFYLLAGIDPVSGERALYIGEAEDVSGRLKNHSGEDYWNTVTVFVSKDENLTKAHIRYIEGKLIGLARDNSSSRVKNANSSGAKLPESDAAEMDTFLQKTLLLLPVLGISDFNQSIERSAKEEDLLICKFKGLSGKGGRSSGGFMVRADSQVVPELKPSGIRHETLRAELIKKGTLARKDNSFIFTKDYEFNSPSEAASFISGSSANGLTVWKNKSGLTLKEVEENQT